MRGIGTAEEVKARSEGVASHGLKAEKINPTSFVWQKNVGCKARSVTTTTLKTSDSREMIKPLLDWLEQQALHLIVGYD
eukprot:12347637-Prorocentrum_lima.AAC.1